MRKLILAMTFIALGAAAISGSLYAGNLKATKSVSMSMDPTALTLASKDLPVVQVDEPF